MRIIFMGTPDFAVPSLAALDEAFDVVEVVTRPDAVRSRGKKLEPSAVKAEAAKLGLPVLEAKRMTEETIEHFRSLSPDIIVVAAFGCILPDAVLTLAPLGCINVHASLLPRWRGAAPIQRAILAGDERAGISIMKLVHHLDAGDYCRQASVPVGTMGDMELTQALGELGARELVPALKEIEAGTAQWTKQDESLVTFAPKVTKAEMRLDPADSAAQNLHRVQASSDAAPARLTVSGKGLRIMKAESADAPVAQGKVELAGGKVLFGCAEGAFAALSVKPDGKREMAASAWARGQHADELTWEHLS